MGGILMGRITDPVLREAYNKMCRDYMRERYHRDPEFRKKRLDAVKEWRETHRKEYNEYMRKYRRKKKVKA